MEGVRAGEALPLPLPLPTPLLLPLTDTLPPAPPLGEAEVVLQGLHVCPTVPVDAG